MAKYRVLDDLAFVSRRRLPRLVHGWQWLRSAKDDWRRTAFLWLAGLLTAYLLLMPRQISYRNQFTVEQKPPKDVWEYVADFANMRKLNPTIISWNLEEESGNFDHWRYKVKYEEYLSNFPSVRSTAVAVFEVIAPPPKTPLERKHGHQMDSSSGPYLIRSAHTTCFYDQLFCVPTKSEFHFSKAPGISAGTLCNEEIVTTCVPLLYFLCRSEIRHQRQTIQRGLQEELSR